MMKLIKQDYTSFVLALIFVVLTSLTMVLCPFLLGKTIDAILAKNQDLLIFIFCLDLLNIIIMTISDYLSNVFGERFVKNLSIDLRCKVLKAITPAHKVEIENLDTNYMLLVNDIDMVKNNYFSSILSMVYSATQCISCLLLLVYYDILLGIIAVAFSILNYKLPEISSKLLSKFKTKEADERKQMFNKVLEILQGYSLISTFGFLEKFQKNVCHQIVVAESASYKSSLYGTKLQEINGFLSQFMQRISYLYAGIITILNGGSISFVTISGNYVRQISQSLNEFVASRIQIVAVAEVYQKLLYIIENVEEEKIEIIEDFDELETSLISYHYNNQDSVFNDLSFKVKKGEKVAIIGASGCGKSTLVKILMGFYRPSAGEVKVDGHIKTNYRFCNIGYLSQKSFIFEGTIKENILFGANYDAYEYNKVLAECGMNEWLQSSELGDKYKLNDNGANISGGQIQRICLARVLYNRKQLLVIDEGFNALDDETMRMIQKNILDIDNVTVINITHKLVDSHLYNQVFELS